MCLRMNQGRHATHIMAREKPVYIDLTDQMIMKLGYPLTRSGGLEKIWCDLRRMFDSTSGLVPELADLAR